MSGAVHAFARQARLTKTVAPFPVPPHQTGHAVFPHPAFRRPSPTRSRRCHPSSRFDRVPSGCRVAGLAPWLRVLVASPQSPAPPSCLHADEVRPLPSSTVILPWYPQYYGPLRLPLPTAPPRGGWLLPVHVLGRPSQSSHCRGRDGPLLFPCWLSHHSTSSTPRGSSGLHPSASPLPWPSPNGTGLGSPKYTFTTRQASLNAADRSVAHPRRMLDAALRPRAFPPEAGSLLPGLLAATRTGPTPAGDDELIAGSRHHMLDLQLLGALP